jgi:thiol:disulfide interchange protein DsbC
MNGARPQDAGTAGCDTAGLKSILEFGAQRRILETPTVVLADGRRLVGAVPPEEFLRDLKESGR